MSSRLRRGRHLPAARALETVAQLAANDHVGGDRPTSDEAQRRLLAAFEEGVLKVMSKMGIADVASYRGARLFDAVGLDRHALPRVPRRRRRPRSAERLDRFERRRSSARRGTRQPQLENPGYFKYRKGGEDTRPTPRS